MNANHLRPLRPRRSPQRSGSRRTAGFTLIEILVALGIFSILLVIILVPLNLGVNLTRIGSARTETQQAAQATMNRIVTELRGATYVFPNERMPGITDKPPYTNNVPAGSPAGTLGFPYYRSVSGTDDVCGSTTPEPFANTSRLDFLTSNPAVQSEPFSIVSYYAARNDVKAAWNDTGVSGNPYAADLNPIVLYRAQIPFKYKDGARFDVKGHPNALIGSKRLPSTGTGGDCSSYGADISQGSRWLLHDGAGEPFLALQQDPSDSPTNGKPMNPALQNDFTGTPATEPASNARITPSDIGLYAPQANNPLVAGSLSDNSQSGRMFVPSTTFVCEDTNNNGIIDRVTITLVMGKYDGAGAENRAQSVRLTQTVDLPNVESRFGTSR